MFKYIANRIAIAVTIILLIIFSTLIYWNIKNSGWDVPHGDISIESFVVRLKTGESVLVNSKGKAIPLKSGMEYIPSPLFKNKVLILNHALNRLSIMNSDDGSFENVADSVTYAAWAGQSYVYFVPSGDDTALDSSPKGTYYIHDTIYKKTYVAAVHTDKNHFAYSVNANEFSYSLVKPDGRQTLYFVTQNGQLSKEFDLGHDIIPVAVIKDGVIFLEFNDDKTAYNIKIFNQKGNIQEISHSKRDPAVSRPLLIMVNKSSDAVIIQGEGEDKYYSHGEVHDIKNQDIWWTPDKNMVYQTYTISSGSFFAQVLYLSNQDFSNLHAAGQSSDEWYSFVKNENKFKKINTEHEKERFFNIDSDKLMYKNKLIADSVYGYKIIENRSNIVFYVQKSGDIYNLYYYDGSRPVIAVKDITWPQSGFNQ